MSKENIVKEIKNELVKVGTNLGVAILKELSGSLGGFAEKIQNNEAVPAQTSEK